MAERRLQDQAPAGRQPRRRRARGGARGAGRGGKRSKAPSAACASDDGVIDLCMSDDGGDEVEQPDLRLLVEVRGAVVVEHVCPSSWKTVSSTGITAVTAEAPMYIENTEMELRVHRRDHAAHAAQPPDFMTWVMQMGWPYTAHRPLLTKPLGARGCPLDPFRLTVELWVRAQRSGVRGELHAL